MSQAPISQVEAEALPVKDNAPGIEGTLTGLKPSTTYYVRLFAKNAAGEEGVNGYGEPISTATQ